jgi:hypothetical protein
MRHFSSALTITVLIVGGIVLLLNNRIFWGGFLLLAVFCVPWPNYATTEEAPAADGRDTSNGGS